MNTTLQHLFGSRTIPVFTTAMLLGVVFIFTATEANAQNPALVEGNCNNSPEISAALPNPGKCGDYDGDGRIGTAEDADGDGVFGTINGALNAFGGNGDGTNKDSVTIVTSGIFRERITITGINGSVTLQAAPGVEAIIDGTPPDNVRDAGRVAYLSQPGITVNYQRAFNGNSYRYFILRNLVVRNWRTGIKVGNTSSVAIESCRIFNNTDGISVEGRTRVAINKSEVYGSGPNADLGDTVHPRPGTGIAFREQAMGTVFFTTVSGDFARGIANYTGNRNAVCAYNVSVFPVDSGTFAVIPSSIPCGSVEAKGRTFFER